MSGRLHLPVGPGHHVDDYDEHDYYYNSGSGLDHNYYDRHCDQHDDNQPAATRVR